MAKQMMFDNVARSHLKEVMPIVSAESGADDLLLRPLCAKNLAPTKPEREGWVDRERLFGFSGRSRKPQMALAAQYGFEDYASPAGGCCFLTDKSYSDKLVDLWDSRGSREYELDDIMLLKVGRHIRPKPEFKLIVSRDAGEGQFLKGYRNQYTTMESVSHNGPLVLIDGEMSEADIPVAAAIVARYGQGRDADKVEIAITAPKADPTNVWVQPMRVDAMPVEWHV